MNGRQYLYSKYSQEGIIVVCDAFELVELPTLPILLCDRTWLSSGQSIARVGLELLGNVCFARLASCRYREALDEIGHDHFDVELDQVGQRMELHIAGKKVSIQQVGLWKSVTYTRGFGIDMAAMIMTSIDRERTNIFLLKVTSYRTLRGYC